MAAVGVLSLLLRWVYSDNATAPAARPRAPQRPPRTRVLADYGLLVPVATVAEQAAAASLQGLLAGHAIRATLAPAPTGGVLVLVFPTDLACARALLTPSG
jgi:hypothetical protein